MSQFRERQRAIAAVVTCNALEVFDFVTYAFFAVQIVGAFFPSTQPQAGLLLSVAVFGVGFIARPLGSVVIGYYADRAGRKPALLLTAVLMTIGTLGLALTPSYAAIGFAAPMLVVACRLVQGFALGGEIGPSTAFLLEIPDERRAWYVSLQFASQGVATVLAGAIGAALSAALGAQAMAAWGWRVPFALGALMVPVALYLRMAMSKRWPPRRRPAPHGQQRPRPHGARRIWRWASAWWRAARSPPMSATTWRPIRRRCSGCRPPPACWPPWRSASRRSRARSRADALPTAWADGRPCSGCGWPLRWPRCRRSCCSCAARTWRRCWPSRPSWRSSTPRAAAAR